MSIDVKKSEFGSNIHPVDDGNAVADTERFEQKAAGNPILATVLGAALGAGFYGLVYSAPWAPLKRYFLGHPVAVAATVLFWFAVAVLFAKWLAVITQSKQMEAIRDEDLLPPSAEDSPAHRWLEENDAGHVSRRWLQDIAKLPSATRSSHLVQRLQELLTRQSQRGTTKHLADDLRELSGRDADSAHDSLGLVRIIIWAIPMIGFLGTVIGITQTLGGLDFANGNAAVQNLKSGLYVAFDTTALGLVLSVVAIFLQFPIERGEQRLLATIDARVGHLVSASLPSDEASDNQTALIADLCRGVQAAVAESLDNQAKLWSQTIDEAQQHWRSVQEDSANKISESLENTLLPALTDHARNISRSSEDASSQLTSELNRWRTSMEQTQIVTQNSSLEASQRLLDGIETQFKPALVDHAESLDESAELAAERFDRQWQQYQDAIASHSDTLMSQQECIVKQYEALAETQGQAGSVAKLQQSLDSNLQRLVAANVAIDRSVAAAGGDGMADAMRILARAVDVLSHRLPEPGHPGEHSTARRAA
ncbi:MAG: MotA/TolQ/ExbB proton channel family protein [Rubripirellula sp.]